MKRIVFIFLLLGMLILPFDAISQSQSLGRPSVVSGSGKTKKSKPLAKPQATNPHQNNRNITNKGYDEVVELRGGDFALMFSYSYNGLSAEHKKRLKRIFEEYNSLDKYYIIEVEGYGHHMTGNMTDNDRENTVRVNNVYEYLVACGAPEDAVLPVVSSESSMNILLSYDPYIDPYLGHLNTVIVRVRMKPQPGKNKRNTSGLY